MALADTLQSLPLVGPTFGMARREFNERDPIGMLLSAGLLGAELTLPVGLAAAGTRAARMGVPALRKMLGSEVGAFRLPQVRGAPLALPMRTGRLPYDEGPLRPSAVAETLRRLQGMPPQHPTRWVVMHWPDMRSQVNTDIGIRNFLWAATQPKALPLTPPLLRQYAAAARAHPDIRLAEPHDMFRLGMLADMGEDQVYRVADYMNPGAGIPQNPVQLAARMSHMRGYNPGMYADDYADVMTDAVGHEVDEALDLLSQLTGGNLRIRAAIGDPYSYRTHRSVDLGGKNPSLNRADTRKARILRQLLAAAPRNPVPLTRFQMHWPFVERGMVAIKGGSFSSRTLPPFFNSMREGVPQSTILRVPEGSVRALPMSGISTYQGEHEYLASLLGRITDKRIGYLPPSMDMDALAVEPMAHFRGPGVEPLVGTDEIAEDLDTARWRWGDEPFYRGRRTEGEPLWLLDVDPAVPWWD